jgi:AraC family transcriptional regulator
LAKIAVELEPARTRSADPETPGRMARWVLARGKGWSVSDVMCTAGPRDRPFEEQHFNVSIAIVTSGTFQYRSSAGCELMTPGSLMLGNAGQYFECGHPHGLGDRCISFAYEQEYFECLAAEARVRPLFPMLRVPPVRGLSGVVVRACAALAESNISPPNYEQARLWEEIAVELAVRALQLSSGSSNCGSPPAAEARVTRIVRTIESRPAAEHELGALARDARLSRYHFLRVFQRLAGLTPHQYVLRGRLRWAATRLLLEPARIVDIALDSGFGDLSNFNHAFRAEFGMNPRAYRARCARSAEAASASNSAACFVGPVEGREHI